ncbi:mitochondrial GTPase [Phyllosticta citriasiana]|uniref:mitochondrial GTPase n=1 Tax=Phyllosticta citriasiana TaxID=595635 RepID=UPI0030FDEBF5
MRLAYRLGRASPSRLSSIFTQIPTYSSQLVSTRALDSSLWTEHCSHARTIASWPSKCPRPRQSRAFHPSHSSSPEPTIYALSTAPGRAAIAVIRISGPACAHIYRSLCPNTTFPKPRHASLRTLYDPTCPPSPSSVLDSALVLYFAAPNTVTGEDLLELHVHGGPAIVRAVLAAIPQCSIQNGAKHDIRYAEAGDFTRRAFLNDRMDLTQIEALGDTLTATTEQQRRLSVRGTRSGLAQRYEEWTRQLLYARGELEALIDFSEDQHFDESPAQLASSVAAQVKSLKVQIETHAANAVRGELLRNGISIVLLGEPNAGKSSLLNRVVGREAAIVSQEAGTTRDVVETGVDIGGFFVRVGDTAGLRKSGTPASDAKAAATPSAVGAIEQEGIRRAKALALDSDVVVCVFSIESDPQGTPHLSLSPEVVTTARLCLERGIQVVAVINKADKLSATPDVDAAKQAHISTLQSALALPSERMRFISCKEASTSFSSSSSSSSSQAHQSHDADPGHIQSFLQSLIAVFESMTEPLLPSSCSSSDPSSNTVPDTGPAVDTSIWQESLGASERQRVLLSACAAHLGDFLRSVDGGDGDGDLDIVVAAETLREAAACLGRITGRGEVVGAGDVEEVLGVVFEKFCVGK